jgi:hypothetical protein
MTQEEFLIAFDSKKRDFEMFTKSGNAKCQSITKKAIKKIFGKKRITKEELLDLLGKNMAKAYLNKKTSEILDTEPPYHIKGYVVKALEIVEYDFGDEFDVTENVWGYIEKLKKGEKI